MFFFATNRLPLLAVLAVLVTVACGASTPQAPTPVSTPTPTPIPPLTASQTAEIRDFGIACREATEEDAIFATNQEAADWVAMASEIQTPPEVSAYWQASVDQVALQTDEGGNTQAQAAYVRAKEEAVAMRPEVQEILLAMGCMTEEEIDFSTYYFEARARLASGFGQGEKTTVTEYAQACKDVAETVPLLDSDDVFFAYIVDWWSKLTPPEGLEEYHNAVLAYHKEVQDTGDPQGVSGPTRGAMLFAASALPSRTQNILRREGCAGS